VENRGFGAMTLIVACKVLEDAGKVCVGPRPDAGGFIRSLRFGMVFIGPVFWHRL